MKKEIEIDINYPEINLEEVSKIVDNRFFLSIAVAKRATQLKEGIKPLIEYDPNRPYSYILIALKEIYEGKIKVNVQDKTDGEEESIAELDSYLDQQIKQEEEAK
eukprot:COSAG01_NODE_52_length_31456_cov_125.226648_10_plen_105_part_00